MTFVGQRTTCPSLAPSTYETMKWYKNVVVTLHSEHGRCDGRGIVVVVWSSRELEKGIQPHHLDGLRTTTPG